MASSFHSNDVSISDILTYISKGEVQLPDFQRGWVWDDYRIRALIASISSSYPVGAIMFLEYGGDNLRFKYRPFTGDDIKVRPDKLVLDGQQRLTSIFCSMGCTDVVKTTTEKKTEINRFYYMDIRKSLDPQIDKVDAILSIPEDRMIKFDFGRQVDLDLSSREKEFENHMFPLNIVYDHITCSNWQFDYQAFHGYNRETSERYAQFNKEILVTIQSYKIPIITLDKSTPKEAVCQVFENVNTGGVALTIFELVTATFAADDFELRKDWEKRAEVFGKNSVIADVAATDFLTSMTLIIGYNRWKNGGTAVSCKKKDVLNLSLEDYKLHAMNLEKAFVDAANFLKEQRIFAGRDLPYSTQLIPLAATFALLGDAIHESTVKNKIARWYWCGVFGEMYGGANETRYALDVIGLMAWIKDGGPEPDTVNRAYFNPTRLLSLQTRLSAAYKGVMALLLKAGCMDFVSGRPMDFTSFIDEAIDIHHIFPRAYAEKHYKREQWNSIVNKTPLFARTNRIIGGHAPSVYLSRIERDDKVANEDLDKYINSHLICVEQLRSDNFNDYFAERAKSLLDIISNAMGKTIANRDSEETIAAFGKSV